jgi:hypothetical protein
MGCDTPLRRGRSNSGSIGRPLKPIVGHKTAAMAVKYTEKRRRARLAIATIDAARNVNRRDPKV